jgi:hypothetical protein
MQRWAITVKELVERTYIVYATSPGEAIETLQEGIFTKVEDSDGTIQEVLSVGEAPELPE